MPACRAGEFGAHYAALWESLEQQSSGGKRIRPRLVNAAYTGLGGTDRALARRVAVAFELLHTAFLIHDDVIDRDTVRRGAPNIAARFAGRARAHGADDRASEVLGRDGRRARRRPRPESCAPRDRDPPGRARVPRRAPRHPRPRRVRLGGGRARRRRPRRLGRAARGRPGAGDARAEDRRVLVRVPAHRGRGARRREPGGGRRARAVRSTRGRRLPDHR